MREYTRQAILDKFERTFEVLNRHRSFLEEMELESDNETMKVYFLGLLRALIFDVVGSLEDRIVHWSEVQDVARQALSTLERRL